VGFINTIFVQIAAIMDNPFTLFSIFFIFGAINLIFPPIPLETAILFAGYLSADGHGSPFVIIAATAGGMFIASLILYRLIKNYGMSYLEKTPLNKIVTRDLCQKAFNWFRKYGFYMIYLGKLVPGMSLYTVLCCGLLRLDSLKVSIAILLSNLLFFTALVLIGRILGENWGHALPWLEQIGLLALASMIIFTVLSVFKYFIGLKKQPKK
jgi:Uncharacterized membrane-associated protein